MKRFILLVGLLLALCAGLFAQNAALPRLAVFEFSTNVDNQELKADAAAVRNMVESELSATGKFRIMTRTEINKLLSNQKFQASSISSSENIEILKMEQISYIVTGTVNVMRGDYAITLSVFNVSSGQISHSDNIRIRASEDFYDGVIKLIKSFTSGLSTSESGSIVQGSGSGLGRTYKIGDTGPGGGIVFAVEGNSYMEISRLLGDFTWDAAVKTAKEFKGGGFNDWYLPSQGELNLVYQNLQKTGIVNLGTNDYWSSSQYGSYYAWVQGFRYGGQPSYPKNNTYSVRAIRAF